MKRHALAGGIIYGHWHRICIGRGLHCERHIRHQVEWEALDGHAAEAMILYEMRMDLIREVD